VADASITPTTADKFIPEVWADQVLEAVEFSQMLQKKVTREYEGVISKMGDTVHIPRLSNLTASTKTAGVGNTINFEAVTEGEQTISIATMQYAAFLLEDIVAAQSKYDLMAGYSKKLGYALSRARETAIAALPQNLSTVVGTLGVELVPSDFLSAWQSLAEAGLLEMSPDPGEEFSIFLSPAAYAAALKVDEFVNRQYNTGADAIQKAKVGDIYGFPVYLSNLLRSPSTGQHECVAMHKGCFALALQKEVNVRSDWLIRNIADGVVSWQLYGTAELNYPPETAGGGSAVDNRGVLLRTV
jgi:hypothetical protein